MESKQSCFDPTYTTRTGSKGYSALLSETKFDWETFCKEFSDLFDSEKAKQQAKIVFNNYKSIRMNQYDH